MWLVRETNSRYHVNHVSTAAAVRIINAKKEELNITCDTAPPYFSLNEMSVENYRTFKLSPPLRNESDRLAIIDGLKDGTIDAVTSRSHATGQDTKRLPLIRLSMGQLVLKPY